MLLLSNCDITIFDYEQVILRLGHNHPVWIYFVCFYSKYKTHMKY